MMVHWCAAVVLLCGLALATGGEVFPGPRELLRGQQLTKAQKANIVNIHNQNRRKQAASNMKEVVSYIILRSGKDEVVNFLESMQNRD